MIDQTIDEPVVARRKPVSAAVLEEPTPEAEARLIEFCEKQLSKMARFARIHNDEGQIGFFELNHALAEHQPINLALISLYNLAKVEYMKAKEAFEDWYAEKYIQEREILNPQSVSSTKWYAAKEIEMYVRKKHRDQYKKLNEEQLLAEQKVALLRRLLDSWASQQFVLARISKNTESEVTGSKMEE
jgi:hypothetical protein